MVINVGSKNQTKIDAIKQSVLEYSELFPNPEIRGIDVNVEAYGHPKNLNEIIAGAKERALKAFFNCDYSVGIESGLMEVPETISGYMEISACIIYDGTEFYIGMSPAFEWPRSVTKFILENKGDASLAFKELKLSTSEKLGAEPGGICAMLTERRMTREDQVRLSFIMAAIYLEKPNLM